MPTKAALRDSHLANKSDDELVELARRTGNDEGAFEELYRRHENAARNVARHILRSRHDADDVVNEAFAGVISAISHGAGPRSNFRQYLMACVRNSCKSRRWCGRSIATDPSDLEKDGAVFEDPERLSEAGLVANAFSSLSADWQQTLWMTAVEDRPTAEVAAQLGRRPSAVAALAHRAREAFAEAYLAQHQSRVTDPACARISPKLAQYVRGRSGDVDGVLVERHLVDCVACSCAVDEMRDLNASLRTLTGPAPLAGIAAGAATAASMVGFLPFATSGGWLGIGAVSGTAVAKVAVIGALLVPAAVVAASSGSSSDASPTSSTLAVADGGGPGSGAGAARGLAGDPADGAVAGTDDTTAEAIDPLLADVVVTIEDTVGSVASTAPVVPVPVPSLPGLTLPGGTLVTLPPTRSSTPTTAGGTVPIGNGGVGATVNGSGVSIDVTVPIVTVPISIDVALPTLPGVTVPGVSIPGVTVLPSITTPAVATPGLTVLPSVTVPNLGLPLPAVSTPEVTLPPVTLPAVTLPAVTVPPISTPAITIGSTITIPPITIPNIGTLLPGLGG